MPRRSVRARRRTRGFLSIAITTLAVLAVVLIVAIAITDELKARNSQDVVVIRENGDGNYVNPNDPESSAYQLELNANTFSKTNLPDVAMDTPSPTPSAEPTPSPSPSPEPTFNPDDPYALVRPTAQGEGFLPVFKKANTEEKRIAITIDECSSAKMLTTICKIAHEYGAKLTLFPTGDNIMKTDMANVLKNCVYSLGYEIENRCYSANGRLYQLNDTMMATEIWKQNMALSYVLGVKYEPHFLRVYGGNGENDPRTHAYLIQEGYLGFANWTISGTDTDLSHIADTLEPGNIYYFKTTEADARKIYELARAAKQEGYEMVTLNALFGYEENKYYEVEGSILSEVMPELEDFQPAYYEIKTGDCTWAVNRLQNRLAQLGYLPMGSADGIFGNDTAAALCEFQARCGMAATGVGDIATQERLYADDAPAKNS